MADCFEPTSTGALQVTLKKGTGLFIDTAATVPFTDPVLVPLVLEADEVVNLDAHQANPRIDVIYATPAVVDFENASVRIWGGASFSNSNLDTARKRSVTITTLKGTAAATPVKPPIPTGSVEVAVCSVPATSGTATVADVRQLIQNGNPQGANSDHFQSWVPGSSGELLATASGSAMECSVAVGDCYADGLFYRFGEAETVSLGLSPVGNFRWDTLVVDVDGAFAVLPGSLGGLPISVGTGQVGIAQFKTLDGIAFPDAGSTVDLRKRYPVGNSQMDDGSILTRNIGDDTITAAKIGFDFIFPELTIGAEASGGAGADNCPLSIQCKYLDLDTVTLGTFRVLLTIMDSAGALSADTDDPEFTGVTTGTQITSLGRQQAIVDTDATGAIVMILQGEATTSGTFYVTAEVLTQPSPTSATASIKCQSSGTWT